MPGPDEELPDDANDDDLDEDDEPPFKRLPDGGRRDPATGEVFYGDQDDDIDDWPDEPAKDA